MNNNNMMSEKDRQITQNFISQSDHEVFKIITQTTNSKHFSIF